MRPAVLVGDINFRCLDPSVALSEATQAAPALQHAEQVAAGGKDNDQDEIKNHTFYVLIFCIDTVITLLMENNEISTTAAFQYQIRK